MIDASEHVWSEAPNFRDPAVIQDPITHYERMFAYGKPFFDPVDQVWYVFSWNGVRQVLRDKHSSVNRFSGYLAKMPPEKQTALRPFFENLGRWMTFIDDEAHRKLRTPVQKAFDSSILQRWHSWLEETCTHLVDVALQHNKFDFMSLIAEPLPLLLICEMLGIPQEEGRSIKKRYEDIVAFFDTSTDPLIAKKALESEAILRSYMHQRIEHARSSSLSSLMTLLVQLQEEDADLQDDDIAANAILILGAGHETTTSLLCTAVKLTFEQPEWIESVASDDAFRSGIIEEALRLQPPLQRTSRIARKETLVDGVLIPEGHRMCLLLGAANRDPQVFTHPNEAQPEREKNPHLAFSGGVHFCAGARVARMEADILLKTLCSRAGHYQLAQQPFHWLENMTFRSLTSLLLERS